MMPLTNTLQQTTLFSSNDFTMPEHFGDDRWTILHGDVMHIVPHMTRAVFDAVITDPPYASGGASQTAKNRSTTEKYSSLRGDKANHFSGKLRGIFFNMDYRNISHPCLPEKVPQPKRKILRKTRRESAR